MNAPDLLRAPAAGAIGTLLVERGVLQPEAIARVIEHQRSSGQPFGEAAIGLGLIKRADLDAVLGVQFGYGHLGAAEAPLARELVAVLKPTSRVAEDLRALRSQLLLRWFSGDVRQRVLAVTSARARDGRSFVAANLAVVFAQQGQRTLLIDADLRHPALGRLFHMPHSAGLAGVLSGRVGYEVIEPVGGLPGLHVLPAGAAPPNPQELIGRRAFGELLDHAVQSYDVVLIDTPAAETCADALLIAARAGAAMLVARRHRSRLRSVGELARQLRDAGAAVVGSMMNQP